MLRYKRNLVLDIFDYGKHKICTLYDNAVDTSGQATNVIVTTERNGWKVLSFDLPTTCETEEGQQPNYRLDYLKADYMIRLLDDDGIDWYLISEPKVTHTNYSKNVSVTAGHISQLLKTKNMGLEFNDEQGNNIGTAYDLLVEILKGTTWTPGDVYRFVEKDQYETYTDETGATKTRKKEKMRTLRASAKTGAFKLITQMCDLFDAKPVFHGDTRTVDIIPMNPFSVSTDGELPSIFLPDGHAGQEENTQGSKVIELHYGQNVSNVTRTINTENIVTKLYAYGSWGDTATGYCGIDECIHKEYHLSDNGSAECKVFPNWTECKFTIVGADGIETTYYFRVVREYGATTKNVAAEVLDLGLQTDTIENETYVIHNPATPSDKRIASYLTWSTLDPASMSYVWDDVNYLAYPVYKEAKTDHVVDLGRYGGGSQESSIEEVRNEFSYLMDFDYYNSVNLLTDEMLQKIAQFQRGAPELLRSIEIASQIYNKDLNELSELIGATLNYCRLPDGAYDPESGSIVYTFNDPTFDNVDTYQVIPDSIVRKYAWYQEKKTTTAVVMGETVEYENKKSDLDWYHDLIHTATRLKPDGMPQEPAASVLYILREDGSWDKSYIKSITHDNANRRTTLTLWLNAADASSTLNNAANRYYLFETNSVSGYVGALENAQEAVCAGTKTGNDDGTTIDHHLYCSMYAPSLKTVRGPGFWGWWWRFFTDGRPSKLYFCWGDTNNSKHNPDNTWYPVYISANTPKAVPEANAYWYIPTHNEISNASEAPVLYRKRKGVGGTINGFYKITDETHINTIVQHFGSVISGTMQLEQILKGQYETYLYTPSTDLQPGNYAFETEYGRYWAFTTTDTVSTDQRLAYHTDEGNMRLESKDGTDGDGNIKWRVDNTYKTITRDQDDVFYHPSDLMTLGDYADKRLNDKGVLQDNVEAFKRTSVVKVPKKPNDHDKYVFTNLDTRAADEIPDITIFYYKSNDKMIDKQVISKKKSENLKIPAKCAYLRVKQVGLNKKYLKIYETRKKKYVVDRINHASYYVDQPPIGILIPQDNNITVKSGGLNDDTGKEEPAIQYLTSTMITVVKDQDYIAESSAFNVNDSDKLKIFSYGGPNETSGTKVTVSNGHFQPGASYIRISCVKGYRDKLTIRPYLTNDQKKNQITLQPNKGQAITYTILRPRMTGDGLFKGLITMMDRFGDLSDIVYLSDKPYLTQMQEQMKEMEEDLALTLGDIHREGYWQKNDYVDEDEQKLYDDAIENIEYVSKPETTYSITYLDLYGTHEDNDDYGASTETSKVLWPDIRIQDAIHLVDPEIAVNCWAYIDQLKKCYDQPWKTTMTINTNLTLMNQHSFADVISYIADVANQSRGRETMFERAKQFTRSGKIMAQLLEDTISTERNLIMSTSSSWYTDEKGAQMFEATDGSSAMRLTGAGFAIADSKDEEGDWRWRTFGTGKGFTADLITAGHIRAVLIEAGTISLDKMTDAFQKVWIQLGHDVNDSNGKLGLLTGRVGNAENTINEQGDLIDKHGNQLASHFVFDTNYLVIQQGTQRDGDASTWNYNDTASVFGAAKLEFYSGTYKVGSTVYPSRVVGIYSGEQTLINSDKKISQGFHLFGSSQTDPDVSLTSDGLNITKGSITIKDGNNETFKVTNKGKLTATDVDVKGIIRANELHIGNTKANLSLNNEGKLTAAAIADNTFATIEMIPDKISLLTWDSLGNDSSSIKLTPNKITISSTGQLEITSDNFTIDSSGNVTMKGKITATSGAIGSWYVDNDMLTSMNPQAHTSEAKIELSPRADSPIKLYAGPRDEDRTYYPIIVYRRDDTMSSDHPKARIGVSLGSYRSGTDMTFDVASWANDTFTTVLKLNVGGAGYAVSVPSLSVYGNASIAGDFYAATASFTGLLSGSTASFTGKLSALTASFTGGVTTDSISSTSLTSTDLNLYGNHICIYVGAYSSSRRGFRFTQSGHIQTSTDNGTNWTTLI